MAMRGFTLAELLVALMVAVIIMIGMVGIISMSFDLFANARNQQSINDSSRKALATMIRQFKCALGLESTGEHDIGLYADVTNEYPDADKNTPGTAPLLYFYQDGDQVKERTTLPGAAPGVYTDTVIASNVEEINFYYYRYGVVPDLAHLSDNSLAPLDAVSGAALVVIELKLTVGSVHKTYTQDIAFRALEIDATTSAPAP